MIPRSRSRKIDNAARLLNQLYALKRTDWNNTLSFGMLRSPRPTLPQPERTER